MKRIAEGARSEGGFTLIELLVVILILGILVSIAMLSVAVTRNRAQNAACRSNLRILLGAVKQYEVANDRTLPPDLETLVGNGYLRKMPQCGGSEYIYDSATGEVSCPNGHEL